MPSEDLDIGGLQIAVDDALLVRRFERVRDLPRYSHASFERYRPARDAVSQRLAVDQLEHQGLHTIGMLRVRKSRRCADDSTWPAPRFALEPRSAAQYRA